jgi:hypothetical protein
MHPPTPTVPSLSKDCSFLQAIAREARRKAKPRVKHGVTGKVYGVMGEDYGGDGGVDGGGRSWRGWRSRGAGCQDATLMLLIVLGFPYPKTSRRPVLDTGLG